MSKRWSTVLEEYNSASLTLSRRDDDWLIRIFQVHPGWKIDFQDEEAVLLLLLVSLSFPPVGLLSPQPPQASAAPSETTRRYDGLLGRIGIPPWLT